MPVGGFKGVTVLMHTLGRRAFALSWGGDGWNDETPDHASVIRGFVQGAGDGLLSRDLAAGVPSALSGLTIVFGMGTSVAPTL